MLVIKIKDSRTIVIADIRALSVQLGWIMHMKELFKQSLVIDFCRVEYYLHGFSVAGGVGADRFIAGMIDVAADISDLGF